MDTRKEKVVLETDRYRVSGNMTLPSEGHRSRLSDHVNRRDQDFFTIQDARLTPLDGGESWSAEVLMVASAHIHLIVPAADG
ncbi:MAG: DUF6812 domain-containing protein [Thermoleophilaceae bacterium]